ncbi:MAG: glycosyltransferase family 39 protein, partial [Phycisphaerales bacterium]|nr:glycosyltransferase family 39 protein [Phycisphaerales bacterium]
MPAVAIALGVLALRLVYLRFFCPYDLVEDEAQYWLWSQHPGWSYYSKGPGVAWVIWLATRVLGDAEWAVRASSAVLGAVATLCAAGLTRDVAAHAWERLGESERASRATPAGAAVFAA